MKTKRVRLSPQEVRAHVDEQVELLRASCAGFDDGRVIEAKRLATSIRVFLHDSKTSKSLLSQLGKNFSWSSFLSTATPYNPRNLFPIHHGLVSVRLEHLGDSANASYRPLVETGGFGPVPPRWCHFSKWWKEIVIKDEEGNTFSRQALVLFVANQDGGAHVDPSIDEAYAKLSRHNSLGWVVSFGDVPLKWDDNPVLPSVRQIAEEVLRTLAKQGLAPAVASHQEPPKSP
jgi:hypothetical protein